MTGNGGLSLSFQAGATAAASAALILLGTTGQAQPTARAGSGAVPAAAPETTPPAPPSDGCCTLAAGTAVELEIVQGVGSRTSRTGENFPIRLTRELTVDGRLVAPAGSAGLGEVVHAARSGMSGRAGELILAVRWLEVNGRRIPLRRLRYGPSQGSDASGAVGIGNVVAAAALPLASVIGLFIHGGEISIPAGTQVQAQIATAVQLPPLAPLADIHPPMGEERQ